MTLVRSAIWRYRWVVCGLLLIGTALNYVDRQVLAPIKPFLDGELHWSNGAYGFINGVFSLAAAVGAVTFGRLIDRRGERLGYALALLVWSAATVGHAFARSIGGFTLARATLGLGEGGNFPCAIKAITRWFPQDERTLATGLCNVGANIGALLAPMLVSGFVYLFGWRAIFVGAGGVTGIFALAWIAFYSSQSDGVSTPVAAEVDVAPVSGAEPFQVTSSWELLARRETWAFLAAKFVTDPIWSFFLIWTPDFFYKQHGLEIRNSWIHLAAIYGIVTVFSVLGTWLTGYFIRSGWPLLKARQAGLLISGVAALPVALAPSVNSWFGVVLVGFAGAAHQSWSANLLAGVSDVFRSEVVGTVVGMGVVAGAVGSFLFPVVAGQLLDTPTGTHHAGYAYPLLFIACGSAYLVAYFIMHLLGRPKSTP